MIANEIKKFKGLLKVVNDSFVGTLNFVRVRLLIEGK